MELKYLDLCQLFRGELVMRLIVTSKKNDKYVIKTKHKLHYWNPLSLSVTIFVFLCIVSFKYRFFVGSFSLHTRILSSACSSFCEKPIHRHNTRPILLQNHDNLPYKAEAFL